MQKAREHKTYSLLKEIGIFLLIWPIAPMICFFILYTIGFFFPNLSSILLALSLLSSQLILWGWIIACIVFRHRKTAYFNEHTNEKNSYKNRLGNLVPVCAILLFILTIITWVTQSFLSFKKDHFRQEYTEKGTLIRLKVSQEECVKFENRYWYKDLCIICPDELPLIDGHCHRCQEGQFVTSNGCRSCNNDLNFLTPEIECSACPNRFYEDGLCKLKSVSEFYP